mgnify:CR=1 FL=1
MPSVLVNFILRYRTWVLIAIIVSSIAASRVRTHNQNRTVLARAIADMKTFGHLS